MGQASASASSTSAIDASGSGNIYDSQPNYVAWIVAGIVALILILAWSKKGR